MLRSHRPTDEQIRIASLLGVDISGDSEVTASAKLEDAISSALFPPQAPRSATERQINFGLSLGLSLHGDTIRVASAKIDDELFRRNVVALDTLALKRGDIVIKRDTYELDGIVHTFEHEYVVSSVHPDSLRVWFRGGNGQGAWPTQLEKIDRTTGEVRGNDSGA